MYEDSEYQYESDFFFIIHTLALFTERRLIYICLIYKDALNDD